MRLRARYRVEVLKLTGWEIAAWHSTYQGARNHINRLYRRGRQTRLSKLFGRNRLKLFGA